MTAATVERRVAALQQDLLHERLRNWQYRLRSDDREIYKWLRQKPSNPGHTIYDDENDPNDASSSSPQEALTKICRLWRRVWDRDPAGAMNPDEYLRQFGPPTAVEEVWPALDPDRLHKAALDQRRRAGGVHGWNGTEVGSFPKSRCGHT